MNIEQLVAAAQRCAEGREWREAAGLYEAAAKLSRTAGDAAAARSLWALAGESWRRDDHLEPAAHALRAALTLAAGEDAALASVQLAAVLGEIGRTEEALQWAQRGLAGSVAPIARDAVCGHYLALGAVAEAKRWLPPLTEGPVGAAHFFRAAQIARLEGRFDEALVALEDAVARLDGVVAAGSGRAAALGERIEILLLSDQPQAAVPLAEVAVEGHRREGRRSMAWRAEAARVRAVCAAGMLVPPGILDPGLVLAAEREMPLLEADLLLARAMFSPDARSDLSRAAEVGESSWIRRGRALLELAQLDRDVRLARQARDLLSPSAPWSQRADRLLASLV